MRKSVHKLCIKIEKVWYSIDIMKYISATVLLAILILGISHYSAATYKVRNLEKCIAHVKQAINSISSAYDLEIDLCVKTYS